jgi:outer membrane protein assembly factor BamB
MRNGFLPKLGNYLARRRWFGVRVLGTGLLVAALAQAASADTVLLNSAWPMYGHDPKHTFRTSLHGPTNSNLLSLTPIGNIIYSQAAATVGGVFIFGAGFSTFGVRADGQLLWKTRVGAEASFSSPALDTDDFLYIGGRDNQLWKKETADGGQVCKYYIPRDGDIKSSPTISVKFKDRVYVTSDVHVYAISTRQTTVNGNTIAPCTLIWQSAKLNGTVFSSVSLADSVVGNGDSHNLVVAAGSFVYLIRDNGGDAFTVASQKIGNVSGPTPLIHPVTGNIYVGSLNKNLYALNPTNLAFLENFPVNLGSAIYASAALSANSDTIYVPTDDGKLHAINVLTGNEVPGFPFAPTTTNRFSSKGYAPVVDGAGNIFIIGQDRWVRALRPNGSVLWQKQIGGKAAAPTIVDGGLIVPSWDHNLYRFCPAPTGSAGATHVCGYTVDTTTP